MSYTLYGATAIKFTTRDSEQEYTLNKNLKINPDATKSQLQTALHRFDNLMVSPVDKILVTSDTDYGYNALNKYEISYPEITISANIQAALSRFSVRIQASSNVYGASARIYSGPLTGYYYIQDLYVGANNEPSIISIVGDRIKITSTRGNVNFIRLTVYYPEGSKDYTIQATITD